MCTKQTCSCGEYVILEERVRGVLHSKHADKGGLKPEVERTLPEALLPSEIGVGEHGVTVFLRVVATSLHSVRGHQAAYSPE